MINNKTEKYCSLVFIWMVTLYDFIHSRAAASGGVRGGSCPPWTCWHRHIKSVDGFVFFRLTYFDYSGRHISWQVLKIAFRSLQIENFLGEDTTRSQYEVCTFGTRDSAPPPPPLPGYEKPSCGRAQIKEIRTTLYSIINCTTKKIESTFLIMRAPFFKRCLFW